jgi:acyl-CoA synthetase (AMP-forming)/AMP-acid ligase II
LNSKGTVAKTLTCSELHKRAEKVAALLQERGKLNSGDHVGKWYKIDNITSKFGNITLKLVLLPQN